MNSAIKLNPKDFEYLTKSDQEYLKYIQRLYLLNSGQLKHFHVLGPWHQVTNKQLNKIVERVAAPSPRPCSRGHVKGIWCVQDPDYVTGPRILKRPPGSVDSSSSSSTPLSSARTRSALVTPPNKYSIPRKYQVVPKPTPWIIMDPSKKKNFISDDPPDPSYDRAVYSARMSRSPRRSLETKRPATTGVRSRCKSMDRYVGSPFTTSHSLGDIESIVNRVSKPTVASTGGVTIAEKFLNKDYVYGSKPCTPNIEHITQPTVASTGGVTIAEKFENKDYVYGSKNVSPGELNSIVNRITKPTVASTGGAGIERNYTNFVYGGQKVQPEQLGDIVSRITKPTVSSRGGVDLADKKFVYIMPKKIKTNVIIPEIETKFMGKRRVSADELNEIVERLNKLTPAYKAKYSINPHVWKDDFARGPAHREIATT